MADAKLTYSVVLDETVAEALNSVLSGNRKVVVETDMHIVKAYRVAEMVRIDIQLQKE